MRRTKKLSKYIVFFLLLAAFFNLLSYSLDQLIVQGEDKIRNLNNQLQKSRITVSNLSNSLNIFQNLEYEMAYEATILGSILNFNFKTRNIFLSQNRSEEDNPKELGYKITDKNLLQKSKELELYYHNKMDQIIDILNHKTNQFHLIFKDNFSSGQTHELLKSMEQFKSYIEKPLFYIKKSDLEKYEDNQDKFDFIWSYIDILVDAESQLSDFEEYILSEYLFSISKYFDILDQYSSQNNFNNYLILSSILAQITGLFFLLLLFRSLIKENY